MNKRQKKKRNKIIGDRMAFLNKYIIYSGRMSGKAACYNTIIKACWSKKYEPFKKLKKIYKKIFIAIDFSNGKDFTAETHYKIRNGVIQIIGTKIIQ